MMFRKGVSFAILHATTPNELLGDVFARSRKLGGSGKKGEATKAARRFDLNEGARATT